MNTTLVFCGPSGSGKSTLLQKLLKDFPDRFGFSVSHTTRRPRSGEIDAVHYHFTNLESFQKAISRGEFIETATYSGNMYGTSKAAVQHVIDKGRTCILDINIDGAKQVKQTDLEAVMVFIMPPSLEELEIRLRARNTETEQSLAMRLGNAKNEMKYGSVPNNFDKIIVNDNIDRAYSELKEFIFTVIPMTNGDMIMVQ